MRWVVAVVLAGCGRFGFDSLSDDARPGTSDGPHGDGPHADAAGPGTCASAIPVTGGVTTIDTCTGTDQIPGCGAAGTPKVVFAFTPPATNVYTLAAYKTGTLQKQEMTFYDPSCTTPLQCAGSLSSTFAGGITHYVGVESAVGGCVTVDFTITPN